MAQLDELCQATEFLDHESETVRRFVRCATPAGASQRELAVALYYAVRDGIDYEVYRSRLSRGDLRASSVLARGRGLCIHKSVLYAACVRALGIPSRLAFVDVRNHLASDRLKGLMGGDVFCYHCYVRILVAERWVNATPVFNANLCRLYRIAPLEFDGSTDSVLHPSDETGSQSMQLLRHHGDFSDLPYEMVIDGLRREHPGMFDGVARLHPGSLVAESPRHAGG